MNRKLAKHKKSFKKLFGINFNIFLVITLLLSLTLAVFSINQNFEQRTQANSERFNHSANFNGIDGYILANGMNNLPNIGSDFTIEMFIKPNGNIAGDLSNKILYKTSPGYNDVEFMLMKIPQENNGNGPIYFHSPYLITDHNLQSDVPVIADGNTWYHLAITRKNNILKMFINGQLSAQTNIISTITNNNENYDLLIGTAMTHSGLPMDQYSGDIDELRISNVARYDNEFNQPTQPFSSDENTLLLVHFDGYATDYSQYHHLVNVYGGVSFICYDGPCDLLPTPTINPEICPSQAYARRATYYGLIQGAEIGDQIKFINPTGRVAGCGVVGNLNGQTGYQFTNVWGSETPDFVGMEEGDSVTIKIGNKIAIPSAGNLIWRDGDYKQVDLLLTSPTQMPTVSPTFAPTSIPTPHNSSPVITTNNLPKAESGKSYSATINVIDEDDYPINVIVKNLPTGLSFKCGATTKKSVTVCNINGIAKEAGVWKVSVYASDDRGGNSEKHFKLLVEKSNKKIFIKN